MDTLTVSLRRRGIVVASIPVSGERARIGSGADCEVQLNDPFLAPLIAELVRRSDRWYMVDAGTSLEGVTRDHNRVLDEPLQAGQTYSVAAFEIVAELRSAADKTAFPKTVIESSVRLFPGTMLEADLQGMREGLPGGRSTQSSDEPGATKAPSKKPVFRPLATAAGEDTTPVPPKRPRNILRIVLLTLIVIVTVFVFLIIMVVRGGKKREIVVTRDTAASVMASQPPAAVPEPSIDGASFARNLEFDKALAAWEATLAAGRDDATARERIVNGAFELGRAYAAANDTVAAARYFDAVVRYGSPESQKVEYARRRLGH